MELEQEKKHLVYKYLFGQELTNHEVLILENKIPYSYVKYVLENIKREKVNNLKLRFKKLGFIGQSDGYGLNKYFIERDDDEHGVYPCVDKIDFGLEKLEFLSIKNGKYLDIRKAIKEKAASIIKLDCSLENYIRQIKIVRGIGNQEYYNHNHKVQRFRKTISPKSKSQTDIKQKYKVGYINWSRDIIHHPTETKTIQEFSGGPQSTSFPKKVPVSITLASFQIIWESFDSLDSAIDCVLKSENKELENRIKKLISYVDESGEKFLKIKNVENDELLQNEQIHWQNKFGVELSKSFINTGAFDKNKAKKIAHKVPLTIFKRTFTQEIAKSETYANYLASIKHIEKTNTECYNNTYKVLLKGKKKKKWHSVESLNDVVDFIINNHPEIKLISDSVKKTNMGNEHYEHINYIELPH